jgi:hypothetical protein
VNVLRAVAACRLLRAGRVCGVDRKLVGWEGARSTRVESSLQRHGARVFALALLVMIFTSCGSVAFPYPSCLFDQQGRYDTGKVIAKRYEDDALLFQFNDPSKGDHGFRWVRPGDNRTLRPCKEATLMDAASREPEFR